MAGLTPAPSSPVFSAPDGYTLHADQKQLEYLYRITTPASQGNVVFYIDHPEGEGQCWNCNIVLNQFSFTRRGIKLTVLTRPDGSSQ